MVSKSFNQAQKIVTQTSGLLKIKYFTKNYPLVLIVYKYINSSPEQISDLQKIKYNHPL